MCLWKKILENAIKDFNIKVSKFNHIADLKIITIANKLDLSYDFHIKRNMHAVEWKINGLKNKNKSLIKKILS